MIGPQSRTLLLVLFGMLSFALLPGAAGATTVHCGDVITQDTRLDSDVICPTRDENAINIRANATFDSVHLDLDGHTVVGRIRGGSRFATTFGSLSVENGTVYGSAINGGVVLSWAQTIAARNLTVYGSSIEIGPTGNTIVTGNRVIGPFERGIHLERSIVDARRNVVMGATAGDGSGIDGLLIEGVIAENISDRNAGDGIVVRASENLLIDSNTTDRNGANGIESAEPDAPFSITGNHAWFNGNLGILAPGVTGGGNWAKHNGNPLQCVPTTLCSTTGKPKG